MNPLYATTVFQSEPPPDGWPHAFAIVTACNPHGRTRPNEENVALDAQLSARLERLGCWRRRATGGSPDFGHAEPGFAVALPMAEALLLGREFEQEAIFWIEEDDLSVVACQGEERLRLGSWRERLAQGNRLKSAP